MSVDVKNDDVGALLGVLRFASLKHRKQRRKDEEASPYINHPIAVAEVLWRIGGVYDRDVVFAAVLHDTIEDTDTTYQDLVSHFGKRVADLVQEVTDDKSLPKTERKRLQVVQAPSKSQGAQCIKLADFISNLSDLKHFPPKRWSQSRRKAYLLWSQSVVAGLRGANPALEEKFDKVLKEARRKVEG